MRFSPLALCIEVIRNIHLISGGWEPFVKPTAGSFFGFGPKNTNENGVVKYNTLSTSLAFCVRYNEVK